MLLTCLFKCSPLANSFPQPSASHVYVLADLLDDVLTPFFFPHALFTDAADSALNSSIVGTRRPLDFFVRFGTGTGTATFAVGRARRRVDTIPSAAVGV